MSDQADALADQWYWHAFEKLEAQGHLHPASMLLNGGDACARLSADGPSRHYRIVRSEVSSVPQNSLRSVDP